MEKLKTLSYSIVFFIGFLTCMSVSLISAVEIPFGFNTADIEAPGNWIKKGQIQVYDDKVVINVNGASMSRYAPTGSMLPLLDEYSNGIRIVPENEGDIEIGDIITFEKDDMLVVHRVVDKGTDEQGTYFITKGDNSPISDGKVRFKDIRYVTIAIVY